MVDQFKRTGEMMRSRTGVSPRGRVLTDLSDPFQTVVQELELESLAEWERLRAAIFSNPEFQESQVSGDLPLIEGRTDFYTLEEAW